MAKERTHFYQDYTFVEFQDFHPQSPAAFHIETPISEGLSYTTFVLNSITAESFPLENLEACCFDPHSFL